MFQSCSPLYLGTNGGVNACEKKDMHENIEVWFNPSALVNALSYGLLADKCRIVEDLAFHFSIFTCKPNVRWIEFEKLGCGLHAHNTSKPVITNKPNFINCNFFKLCLTI